MRSPISFLAGLCVVCAALSAEARVSFQILGDEPGSWPELLSSIGLTSGASPAAGVVIVPHATDLPAAEWKSRVEQGSILVLEGESPLAAAFGFKPSQESPVPVRSVEDLRAPDVRIIWEKALDLPIFELPPQARVFARERWKRRPLWRAIDTARARCYG